MLARAWRCCCCVPGEHIGRVPREDPGDGCDGVRHLRRGSGGGLGRPRGERPSADKHARTRCDVSLPVNTRMVQREKLILKFRYSSCSAASADSPALGGQSKSRQYVCIQSLVMWPLVVSSDSRRYTFRQLHYPFLSPFRPPPRPSTPSHIIGLIRRPTSRETLSPRRGSEGSPTPASWSTGR